MTRLNIVLVIVIIVECIFIFWGCSKKFPTVQIRPFPNQPEIVLKGEHSDNDGKIDYWQHYKNGKPFGSKIWIKR